MSDVKQRAAVDRFRELHRAGCFVMPNPWDAGSAKMLARLGFKALASSSAALAWRNARGDNQMPLDQVLAHLRELVAAVDLPINADFENGFAAEPEQVAANVRAAIETGIAGLSIEDASGDPAAPLFDLRLSTERIAAARTAVDRSGSGVILTARSEGFVVGLNDLDDSIARLRAYSAAGADCLFAPGVRTLEHVEALVQALAPRPINVLVFTEFATVEQLAQRGVRRISTGGALARTAWSSFLIAAREIADEGSFHQLGRAFPSSEVMKALGLIGP